MEGYQAMMETMRGRIDWEGLDESGDLDATSFLIDWRCCL